MKKETTSEESINRMADEITRAKQRMQVLVYDVPEAGRLLGLNRNKAYAAAASGELPTIRFGKLLKVPKAAIDLLLERALQPRAMDAGHAPKFVVSARESLRVSVRGS